MSPTRRPAGEGPCAAPRYSSTSAAIEARSPGYQVPATHLRARPCHAPDSRGAPVLFITPMVDRGEDVVPPLEVPHDRLLEHHLSHERAVQVREAGDVVAGPLLGVFHGGARLHDEGP